MKVISSLPLSQYIAIRQYAHEKLLMELKNTLEKKSYSIDDIRLIKSILKSLSFLKSNALIRKQVIVKAWEALFYVISNLENEEKRLEELNKRVEELNNELNQPISTTANKSEETVSKKEDNNSLYIILDQQEKIQEQKENEKRKKQQIEQLDFIQQLIAKDLEWIGKKDENKENIIENDAEKQQRITKIIENFIKDFQFFIKNAIFDDEAKAMYLGELLRTGDEIKNFDNITISETKLSLLNEPAGNDLFEYNFSGVSKDFPQFKEYTKFLIWLFYDNTTIIRKTLNNFINELEKDKNIKDYFYNNETLKPFFNVKNSITAIKSIFEKKVQEEYYYSSFKGYLGNGDQIDFVEKLIYVAYAKFKLKDLIDKGNKGDIETDTQDLMEVFAAIMGADGAFFVMKRTDENDDMKSVIYPISLYNFDEKQEWKDNLWSLNNYYTRDIIKQEKSNYMSFIFPHIPIYSSGKRLGEQRELNAKNLGIYLITNPNGQIKESKGKTLLMATITFLYGIDNNYAFNNKKFRINFQESGRLLLLLKNEINRYVIDYLQKDKVFDLWVEKHKSERKFDKIYANSSHVFRKVYNEMNEFETLDINTIEKLSETWFFLSNETISYLYSNIERNCCRDNNEKNFLNIEEKFVKDENNTLGETFNSHFISIIKSLLKKRWRYSNEGKANIITINGKLVNDYEIESELKDVKINCRKELLRTIITQCLNNSLNSIDKHGHRGSKEVKEVKITVSSSSIVIEDHSLTRYYTKDEKTNREKQFQEKKKYIKQMRCDDYSSTTLTTLQGLINYLSDDFDCDFGFNEENNFKLTITFNK